LTFSRRQLIQTVDLDLNEVCATMTKMLQRLIGEHITFERIYSSDPAMIHADRGMMEQVLLNLVINSRDAMPKGGRLLLSTALVELDESAIGHQRMARPGSFVRLSVSDTGQGIAPENLPRIFEPFFTTKEVGKGTGLGLATVLGIVEQHKGWIEVQSRLAEGTLIHVYLPRLQRPAMLSPEKPEPLLARGNETILLVEDEPAVRMLARQVLAQMGYEVYQAANAHEAVQIWKEHRGSIHLLLTDIVMPGGMNGRDLAQHLQKDRPGLKTIYCSGYSQDILGKDLVLEENVRFLQKPYTPAKLLILVRNCLDGR
jgi:CheY-like chemotaxis protein